jgi:hypothetical protein
MSLIGLPASTLAVHHRYVDVGDKRGSAAATVT